jgi:sensor histidine kinase YesM
VFQSVRADCVDFCVLASSEEEGFKLAANIANAELLAPFEPLVLFVKLLLGCSSALFIFLACFCVKLSLRNLKTLSCNMNKVRGGDYFIRANIDTNDELEMLGDAFNLMIEHIREREEHEKEMQYKMLISEIDPHFIYNTLNTITYLAKLNRAEDVVSVNTALISMLKDRLKMKGHESFDMLENELYVINQYLIIQNYMHKGAIRLTVQTEDSLLTQRIPKNILQPLVENAIKHGILAKKNGDGEIVPGEIVISVNKEAARLRIFVRDTGKGMGAAQIAKYFTVSAERAQTPPGENIGVKNIIMRLKYLFGDNWRLNASSSDGIGTAVEIEIPCG